MYVFYFRESRINPNSIPNLSVNLISSTARVKYLKITNTFWAQVLEAWASFSYWYNFQLDNQVLWFNSRIKIGNKPFIWKDAFQKNLLYVHQLFREGRIKTQQEMKEEYAIDFVRYNGLIKALPPEWIIYFCKLSEGIFLLVNLCNYDCFKSTQHLSRLIYRNQIGDITLVQTKLGRWRTELSVEWSVEEFTSMFDDV